MDFRSHDPDQVNCVWPRTLLATSPMEFKIPGARTLFSRARRPEIVADAAAAVLLTPASALTGQCLLYEDFLRTRGVTNLDEYAWDAAAAAENSYLPDLFL